MKKNNKKGFTLAELLIVVAIIAVLVAIAVPIFNAQLEKSREAVDIANVRSAYAEVVATYLADGTAASASVTAKQKNSVWDGQSGILTYQSNGVEQSLAYSAKSSGNTYTVTVTGSGAVSVT